MNNLKRLAAAGLRSGEIKLTITRPEMDTESARAWLREVEARLIEQLEQEIKDGR